MKNQKGFSLIELMIVVVIIGILSTVAVPQYQNFQKKAKQSEAKSSLSSLYTSLKTFQAEWNFYYADFRALGFDQVGNLSYDVGFGAAGPNGPVGHPSYQGVAAAQFSAGIRCPITAQCTLLPTAFPPTAGHTINAAGTTFVAGARGNLDADATVDTWQMTHLKVLTQPAGGRDVEN